MNNKNLKVLSTITLAGGILFSAGCTNKEANKDKSSDISKRSAVSVPVANYSFDTAANMFAYAEFELSGEPLVESLGLDLDVLDAKKVNKPEKFDYTAGIEAYEYSEEAMYEVVEKSGLGLHLINGPIVKEKANQTKKEAEISLGERFYELADAVGYPRDEIFTNMFPTFIEYSQGDPHYAQMVDTSEYASNDDGTYVPNYQVNFKSLRWDRAKMNQTLTPAAYGGTFLKQALWAGDFLGGFHTVDKEDELPGETGNDDQDPNIALGVSSPDGMQGMILLEEMWNKINYIRNGLFYSANENKLTKAGAGSQYDPSKGFVYLPHEIKVEETEDKLAPDAKSLTVADKHSYLKDQWLMLWPAAELYGITDQRLVNKNVPPSFQALFDGSPYPSAPKENVDQNPKNDVSSSDPYSVNRDILLHVFKNMDAMHFNQETGSFVAEHDGKVQGKYIDTFQSGYAIESLRIFQRAIDGLPVGYASGESAKGLQTAEGKRALEMIRLQANFIMNNLVKKNGLVAKGFTVGKGVEKEVTLEAQLGAIRGLTAAYLATNDEKYREAARNIYVAMDKNLWKKDANAYITSKDEMVYTPFTAGGVAAVYRVTIQNLSNKGTDQEQPEALEVESVVSRYTDFFETVIDGPTLKEGMQASEFWDTGDYYKNKDKSENTDKDHVPQIQAGHGKNGISPILLPVKVLKN